MTVSTSPDPLTEAAPSLCSVTFMVEDRDGTWHRIAAPEGISLQLALRQAGLPIRSVCGGKKACGTCRVRVHADWIDRLSPADPVEINLLNILRGRGETDRLSCQIRLTPNYEGLHVRLDR